MKNQATASYRISDGPDGRRWWAPYERLPATHTLIRIASLDEIKLMQKIERHRNPPLLWGDQIKEMISRG